MGRHASGLEQCAHTVLVVHGKLALQLLSDAGHVCVCVFGVDAVTGCDVVKIYGGEVDQLGIGV